MTRIVQLFGYLCLGIVLISLLAVGRIDTAYASSEFTEGATTESFVTTVIWPTTAPGQTFQPAPNARQVDSPLPPSPHPVYLPLVQTPHPFTTPYPADGAVDQSPNVWLSWQFNANLGATLPVTFSIYIEPSGTPLTTPAISGNADAFWDPFTFESGAMYHWRVTAEDATGRIFESPIWTFSTEAFIDNPDLDAMVVIPGGYFWQGCDSELPRAHPCFSKEFPLRQVWIDSFEIDKYEVTNREYRACVDAEACASPIQFNSNKRDDYFANPDYDEYPVLYVSHWDAEAFCAWEDKRLPTEAEWEKAARGPIDTREWPWGPEYPDCTRSNFTDDIDPEQPTPCLDDTDRVGSRPRGASPYGLMDTSGNVFEWVHDLYNVFYYQYAPDMNPQGPDVSQTDPGGSPNTIPYFTIRGGSYRAHWFYVRATHRHWGHKGPEGTSYDDIPYFRNNFVGFRCARSLP